MGTRDDLSSLLFAAEKAGIPSAMLFSTIQAAVMAAYMAEGFPYDSEINVEIREPAGAVSLMRINEDVTPPKFREIALQTAKTAVRELMRRQPAPTPGNAYKIFANILFWAYNGLYSIIFLWSCAWLFLLAPPSVRDSFSELFVSLNTEKKIFLIVLLVLPVLTSLWTLIRKFFREPAELLRLYFFVELPLILLLFIRLALPVDTTPPLTLFTVILLGCPLILYWRHLTRTNIQMQLHLINLATLQVLSTTALYITAIFSFLVPPVVWALSSQFFRENYSSLSYQIRDGSIIGSLLGLFFQSFLSFLALAILTLPYVCTYICIRSTYKAASAIAEARSAEYVGKFMAVCAVVMIGLIAIVSYQNPNNPLLDKAEKLTKAVSYEERQKIAQDLMPHEDELKKLIKENYNSNRKYLFSRDDSSIEYLYTSTLNYSQEDAEKVQAYFLTLAHPFVYQGISNSGYFYNLQHEIFNTEFDSDEPAYPTPTPFIKLVSRKVSATTDSSHYFATVTIEEEFANNTYTQQEATYEFSLPEEAVLTDLWLGEDLQYRGISAPAGAAQRTYETEVNRRRDPSLLEQVGPRQYRLRVYPIPAKNDPTILNGRNEKVKFSYVVAARSHGFALPHYTLKKIDDVHTQEYYFIDNQPITPVRSGFIPLLSEVNICNIPSFTITEPDYSRPLVTLLPHARNPLLKQINCTENQGSAVAFRKPLHIAVLYDSSYANRKSTSLNTLKEFSTSPHSFDVYLFNDHVSKPLSLRELPEHLAYFGSSNFLLALNTVTLNRYDAIIALVDSNTYLPNNYSSSTPLFIVHEQGDIPPYSANFTVGIIASGGAVADNVEEVMHRLALFDALSQTSPDKELEDIGPFWSILSETAQASSSASIRQTDNSLLSKITARSHIFHALRKNPKAPTTVMDAQHALASSRRIVSPFTSLLALVNQEQMNNLALQMSQTNRYETSNPQTPWNGGGGIFFEDFSPIMWQRSAAFSPAGGSDSDLHVNLGWSAPSAISSFTWIIGFALIGIPLCTAVLAGLIFMLRKIKLRRT